MRIISYVIMASILPFVLIELIAFLIINGYQIERWSSSIENDYWKEHGYE